MFVYYSCAVFPCVGVLNKCLRDSWEERCPIEPMVTCVIRLVVEFAHVRILGEFAHFGSFSGSPCICGLLQFLPSGAMSENGGDDQAEEGDRFSSRYVQLLVEFSPYCNMVGLFQRERGRGGGTARDAACPFRA